MSERGLTVPSDHQTQAMQMPESRRKQFLKRLIGDRNYYQIRANRNVNRDRRSGLPHLFIHQMGKVGSTSVVATLEQMGIREKYLLYQTHFLSPTGYAFLEELELQGHGGWSNLSDKGKSFLSMSAALSRAIDGGYLGTRPVKVITLVRDPVATNLSGFFHNTSWWSAAVRHQVEMRTAGWQTLLWQHFLDIYPHDVPATWFDMEMKSLFHVDVLSEPFPREQGYKLYESPSCSVLLMKLENLRYCGAEAIDSLLGIEGFQLSQSNKAENKWYADIYREFKLTANIPESYLSRQYETEFAKHFYGDGELLEFRNRWGNHPLD